MHKMYDGCVLFAMQNLTSPNGLLHGKWRYCVICEFLVHSRTRRLGPCKDTRINQLQLKYKAIVYRFGNWIHIITVCISSNVTIRWRWYSHIKGNKVFVNLIWNVLSFRYAQHTVSLLDTGIANFERRNSRPCILN